METEALEGWRQAITQAHGNEAKASPSGGAQPLILRDGEDAEVTFLDNQPTNLLMHTVPTGKKKYESFQCAGDGCAYCAIDKPRFRCVFNVVDHREIAYTTYKEELAISKDVVRYFVCSAANAEALLKMLQKTGLQRLAGQRVWIFKTGSGPQTITNFLLLKQESMCESIMPMEIRSAIPTAPVAEPQGKRDEWTF
jgi:hypothetical protein